MSDPGLIAQRQVQANWPKFGSIRKSCTYKSRPNSTYNPADQTAVESPSTDYPIFVIFDNFSFTSKMAPQMEDDEEGGTYTDKKALFPFLDLPVVPQMGDFIVNNVTGETWRVMAKNEDPVPALYELHVRLYSV